MSKEKIYRIKSIEHDRVMNKTTISDNGYLEEICVGEAGLETFAKTHDIANIEKR